MTYHVQFPGLGLEFTLDRVAFTVFGMPIYWYGILIATGLALAIVFAFSHARRFGIDSDRMVDVILIGTVCAVLSAAIYAACEAAVDVARISTEKTTKTLTASGKDAAAIIAGTGSDVPAA